MSYELEAGSLADLVGACLSTRLLLDLWDSAGRSGQIIARFESGHCIDAPELLPAGGCRTFEVEGMAIPEQITFWRPGSEPLQSRDGQ